jgi:peptidoglycan/LPS O-acetylase OafA/YrhL
MMDARFSANGASALTTSAKQADATPRIDKLDAVRFVAAFWVALSHGAFPVQAVFQEPFLHRLVGAIYSSFDGVAAVMVFFIVSGFCIHLPYVGARELPLTKFIIRRYIRIGIPLAAILTIMQFLGGAASVNGHAVLWSIYAELIYYTIYPALFMMSKSLGWSLIIALFAVISAVMTLTHLSNDFPWQFGSLTWLWGLPIWVSGCLLAEKFRTGSLLDVYGNLWLWRITAWALGAAATLGVFHTSVKIGYPVSMLLFTIFAFFWLSLELQTPVSSWRLLESFGRASYSLYLVHNVVLGLIRDHLELSPSAAAVVFPGVAITLITYLFYKLIEAPSHLFARRAARLASGWFSGQPAAVDDKGT